MATTRTKRLFFLGVLAVTGYFTYLVLKDFISVILLALIYSLMVKPMYDKLQKYLKSHQLASLVTLIVSFIVIFAPIAFTVNLFVNEALSFRESVLFDSDSFVMTIEKSFSVLYESVRGIPVLSDYVNPANVNATIEQGAKNISTFLVNNAIAIGSSSAIIVTNFFIFLILIYFMIPSIPKMKKFIEEISPLEDKIDMLYIDRATSMITTMVKGTFVVAIVQGLLGALFLWIAGVDYLLTLTLGMIILSIIPIVGTAFITIPVSIFLFLNGQPIPATIVFLGQIIVVSNIDNILRAELVSRETSLHPAIMLLSIIGGISMFGVWGFIYGPVVMILFLTSLEIYRKHMKY